jgi:hypothetical protein
MKLLVEDVARPLSGMKLTDTRTVGDGVVILIYECACWTR